MTIANPAPLGLVLLNLTLPGIALAGAALARRATEEPISRRLLGPALGVGATVVAVEGFGRATGSFHAGLAIGMTAVGLIGILLRLRDRPARGPDGVAWRPMAVGAAMATAMLAPAAILWSFHDELIYQGHMAISSQLLNGGYPPRAPTFPEFELRYHHGFNVLVAAIVALTRLDVPAAIDRGDAGVLGLFLVPGVGGW